MKHIKNLLLKKIRLSTYFWIFFLAFLVLSFLLPGYKYDSNALTLFSVNSFLYGFYIAPILAAQKSRIDELHRIIRSEANALFSLMLKLKRLPPELRNPLQTMVKKYIEAKLKHKGANGGEEEYEALISYCIDHKGAHQDQLDKILEGLVANQQNRTNFNMQAANKVYANEWHVMLILFSITLGFIMTLHISGTPLLHVIRALLCTGLSMLILILVKLSTLTHKRAEQTWSPLKKLIATNFYRID